MNSDDRQQHTMSQCSGVEKEIHFTDLRRTLAQLKDLVLNDSSSRRSNQDDSEVEHKLKEVVKTLDSQFSQVERQNNELRDQMRAGHRHMEHELHKVEQKILRQLSSSTDGAKELTVQNTTLNMKNAEQNRQVGCLQAELSKVTQEAQEYRETRFDLDAKIGNLSTRVRELEKEKTESEAKIECLEKQILRQRTTIANTAQRTEHSRSKSEDDVFPQSVQFNRTHRLKSQSCDQLASTSKTDCSLNVSCLSLDNLALTSENRPAEMQFWEQMAQQPAGVRFSAATQDTGYSESSGLTIGHASAQNASNCGHQLQATESMLTEALSEINQKMEMLMRMAYQSPLGHTETHPLPSHIQGFCVNIQDSIHIRIKEFSRSLGIPLSRFQVLQDSQYYRSDFPSLFWACIDDWNGRCTSRGTMLSQLIQACEDCQIQNPLNVKPMPPEDRWIIETNYSCLNHQLMVEVVLTYLRNSGYLTSGMVQYVLEPQARPGRVLRFVDILPVFGRQALDILQQALRESGQEHVAHTIEESCPRRFRGVPTRHRSEGCEDSYIRYPTQTLETKKKMSFFKKLNPFRNRKYTLSNSE